MTIIESERGFISPNKKENNNVLNKSKKGEET